MATRSADSLRVCQVYDINNCILAENGDVNREIGTIRPYCIKYINMQHSFVVFVNFGVLERYLMQFNNNIIT